MNREQIVVPSSFIRAIRFPKDLGFAAQDRSWCAFSVKFSNFANPKRAF